MTIKKTFNNPHAKKLSMDKKLIFIIKLKYTKLTFNVRCDCMMK